MEKPPQIEHWDRLFGDSPSPNVLRRLCLLDDGRWRGSVRVQYRHSDGHDYFAPVFATIRPTWQEAWADVLNFDPASLPDEP